MKIPFIGSIGSLIPRASLFYEQLSVRDKLQRRQLRLLMFADELGPTVQINWLRPLKAARAVADCAVWLMEETLIEQQTRSIGGKLASRNIEMLVAQMRPDAIVACRYGGRSATHIVAAAQRRRVPLIFHIDDNLLSVPPELGPAKVKKYAAPDRQGALTELLTKSTLVYSSTALLLEQLMNLGIRPKAHFVGEIAGAADPSIGAMPSGDGLVKIGYMASSSHSHDLEPLVPILDRILGEFPNVSFELFGTIAAPPLLADKIAAHHPPIRDYDHFIRNLAELDWDIGLAPLRLTDFNLAKTNTKWIEYAAAGVPVICSRHPVYASVCAAKGAVDADSPEEWDRMLRLLIQDRTRRLELRQAATALVRSKYSVANLTRQVARVLSATGLSKKSGLLAELAAGEAKEANG